MKTFEHVDHLWQDGNGPSDPVDQLIHRSNLLGADLRITNYAGGNTSVKTRGVDAVDGRPIEVLWIKGSGGDLGTLTRAGLAALDNGRVLALERTYRGREHEDEQVALLPSCLVEPRGAAPSIDTPLHAVVPHPHVDHVHPDAVIALATAADGERLVNEVYGGQVGWLPWQRPGYDLALRLRDLVNQRPGLRGVVLGGHGLIAWGEGSRECYETTLELIEEAARAIERHERDRGSPFGGRRVQDLGCERRRAQAARAMPLLRGLAGNVVAHFRDDQAVLAFSGSRDAPRLAREGTSCPDHFLRTKQRPLLLDLPPGADPEAERPRVERAFQDYRDAYARYYQANAGPESPGMRAPTPVVVLWPGVGMVTLAASKREARIASEFYVNAINVMRGAEAVSSYRGLSDEEAFRIEYWALEEAKLRRLPKEGALSRRVALITGAGGGIGRSIARRFAAEGASLVLVDIDEDGLRPVTAEIGEQALTVEADISDEAAVTAAFQQAALAYGGVDLLVNCAGISVSHPLTETSAEDYDRLYRVIERGSFLASRAFARQAMVQGRGGDIVYIASKNGVVAGANNVAYSSVKAAQLHQMRLLAVELAPHGIRVNAVNPDAVVRDSKIFAGEWGDNRAQTYGVRRENLGDFYAQRTLLKQEILPDDVAAACFVLVGGELRKTTGAVVPVDGGVAAAFLR